MNILDVVFVYQLKTPHLVRWHSRRHAHRAGQYELHYFLDGEGTFENGNTTWTIRRGSLFYSKPGEIHQVHPGGIDSPISYYAVLFQVGPETEPAELLEDRRFGDSFPRKVGTRRRLLLEEIKNKFAHPIPARRRAATHLLTSFLYDLYADALEQRRDFAEASEFSVHLDRAIALFQKHIADNRRVSDIAHQVGISQAHLTRLFTQRFGLSPLQYYRRLKMEIAISMLLNSTAAVKEIAFELGYANPFHFSRSFTDFTGMSPTVYRSQYFQDNPTHYASRVLPEPD
jgi:AraC-like DNA-binding protein